ncbi:MAG: YheC/YheD family protein [Syntrophomonadaceae bacterium]|nr:YheC/YheD family protein [Syntrophomonadaceae bacterium]
MKREGPIVGILVDIRGGGNKPFGPQTMFIRQLLQAGDNLGQICFAFTVNDVNFDQKQIRGYRWTKGAWVRQWFSLPHVVYPRDFGVSPSKVRLRQRLMSLGCQFSSPLIIGKWRSWEILSACPELSSTLPETRKLEGVKSLREMVGAYGSIYIKPVDGSQGRNIARLRQINPNGFELCYNSANGLRRFAGSISALYAPLSRLTGSRKFIMQEEIKLIRFKNGIADVRVLVQKDYDAVWKITGKACRVGTRGAITSNISGGGHGYTVRRVLEEHFDEKHVGSILHDLDELALMVVDALERQIDTVGEMGIDLGIDVNGKLWFIEANLRPARYVFIQMGDMDTRMLAVRRPMEFAHYLSGYKLPPQYLRDAI